jgi:hypothetical protein
LAKARSSDLLQLRVLCPIPNLLRPLLLSVNYFFAVGSIPAMPISDCDLSLGVFELSRSHYLDPFILV